MIYLSNDEEISQNMVFKQTKKVSKLSAGFFLLLEINFPEETIRSTKRRQHSSKIKKYMCVR